MVDPASYRPAPGTIPTSPGVYRFLDKNGRPIYVGKAKNLRNRLNSYFANPDALLPRTYQMVHSAHAVRWTVVATELDALQLEYTWIKQFDPRYNVIFRDGKTYPMLALTVNDEYPKLGLYHGTPKKGVRYFGPYAQSGVVREILELMTRVFPLRTCSAGVFRRHQLLGRPCLLGYINKCSAPCTGQISLRDYQELTERTARFLSGQTDEVVGQLRDEMMAASDELDFETAAKVRDQLMAIDKLMERQTVVFLDGTDADVVGFATDELEAAVQIFHVRGGRIRGQRGWVSERSAETELRDPLGPEGDPTLPVLVQNFLMQFYGGVSDTIGSAVEVNVAESARLEGIPRLILVPVMPTDSERVEQWLTSLRGSRVELRVPQRGDKRELQNTVTKNAVQSLHQHKLRRVGDLTARSAALEQLQEALGLDSAPLRIECTDISHIQGTDVVASLVVFEDGLPRKSDYRRYTIREAAGGGHSNDVASIAEVTRRRFQMFRNDALAVPDDDEAEAARHMYSDAAAGGFTGDPVFDVAGSDAMVQRELDPETGKPRRFAYPPQLFIVDGGAPQVAAAAEVLAELGITDVALCGLAKRLEEVWLPGDDEPVILPRNSEALFLLQRLRDEAHRFAITFHRAKRSKRLKVSQLDAIHGLGAVRKKALLRHFGSFARIRTATPEEITEVDGIGPVLAETIATALHADTDAESTNESGAAQQGLVEQ